MPLHKRTPNHLPYQALLSGWLSSVSVHAGVEAYCLTSCKSLPVIPFFHEAIANRTCDLSNHSVGVIQVPSNEQFLGISYDAPKPLAVMRIQGRVEPKMPIKFLAAADRLTSWCSSAALPMWSSRGIDSAHRFVEQISQQGLAEADVNRRVRVQFRQYYSLAHSHFLGLSSDLLETAASMKTIPCRSAVVHFC